MSSKLKVVIVDDDPLSVALLEDYCNDSQIINVVATYSDPRSFLKNAEKIKFDLCILDIMMPQMEGTMVAQLLKNKPVIFVTGVYEKLREALDLSPIDVVTKPIDKARLDKALGRAFALLVHKDQYKTYNIAESTGKIKLFLPDILMVTTDTVDSRHKQVYTRSGRIYTLMDYSIEELLEDCPMLVQVNKGIAISLEIVNEVEHDNITIKGIKSPGVPRQVQVGRAFRKSFVERLSYF